MNDLLKINIEDEEVDTIGGWMLSQNIEIKENDYLFFEGYRFTVVKMDGHQILTIDVEKIANHLPENPEKKDNI